jgi:hypothetical protein
VKKIFVIIALLSVFAVGRPPYVNDTDLLRYVERFDFQYNIRLDPKYRTEDVVVLMVDNFDDDDRCWKDTIIGICTTSPFRYPTIQISREFWKEVGDPQKEALYFHEAGHCLLGRDHDNREYLWAPKSLMRSWVLEWSEYNQLTRERYLMELFQPSAQLLVPACFK